MKKTLIRRDKKVESINRIGRRNYNQKKKKTFKLETKNGFNSDKNKRIRPEERARGQKLAHLRRLPDFLNGD